MSTDQPQGQIEREDITGFAAKLDAWARDLTPAEQTLLDRLVSRAAAADPEPEDTRGHIIIIDNRLQKSGIIVIGGQPSPLLLSGLGLSGRALDGGGGLGLSGRAVEGGGGIGRR